MKHLNYLKNIVSVFVSVFVMASFTIKAEESMLGEWYECGWNLAKETRNIYKSFNADVASREAIIKLLATLGVTHSSIKQNEFELLAEGWLDAHSERSPKYSMPPTQERSLLPLALQGFHTFKSTGSNLSEQAGTWINAVVLVKINLSHGTGFFIRPGLILTNWHVIDGAESIEVKNDNLKESYTAKLIMSKEIPDIALLQVNLKNHHILDISDSDSIRPLDEVVLIGYPAFDHLTATFYKGTVSSIDRIYLKKFEVFQVDISGFGGNSGGPLIGPDGGVVGILTAAVNTTATSGMQLSMKIAQKMNFILPHISEYLK